MMEQKTCLGSLQVPPSGDWPNTLVGRSHIQKKLSGNLKWKWSNYSVVKVADIAPGQTDSTAQIMVGENRSAGEVLEIIAGKKLTLTK